MKFYIKLLFLLLVIPLTSSAQTGLDTLKLKTIFYEPLLAGNRPDFISFSPDMTHIYYQANDSSMIEEERMQVKLNGTSRQPGPEAYVRGFDTSPNGKKIVYEDNGDIWIANLHFNNKQQLIDSELSEYDASWSPDSRHIAFVQEGDVWMMNVKTAKLTQITAKDEDEPGYSITAWAGNDKLVLVQLDTSDYKEYYFPEYIEQYVQTGATRRGVGTRMISIAYLDSMKIEQLYEQKGYVSTSVSSSGRYVAIDLIDPAMKYREIKVFDIQNSKIKTVFRDSTDGWLYGTDMEFAPNGNKLMFQSEQDGWNHIYTVNPDGSRLKQHTMGTFEVPWVEWISGDKMVFASTEVDPGERHIYTLNILNGEIEKLTSEAGYRQDFELSPDNRYLVYEYTYFNEPFELYALDLKNPSKEVRLTQTTPERFNDIEWQKKDYIRFTARDGETEVSMTVLEPIDKKVGKQYPVVVFVHGAGSLQNVYKGWSNSYYREYMFHQYLTARGYYVMQVDYRHSTGYGREFREDVTNWMGKFETHDIVDGINYLAKNYTQADTSRVGIYGGSYGGFMALYATSVEPSYFDAAAALRAVTNWENYYYTNPWYTLPRLGKPKVDSLHYARSSPITYVNQLQQPVLILHGLIDNNVGFQDAAQYIHELIQAGDKEFEMMMYPSQRHSFHDPDAWYDEYTRIYEFFNEHLKNSTD